MPETTPPPRRPLRTLTERAPAAAPASDSTTAQAPAASGPVPSLAKVREVLEQIRPAVQADGGDVELVDVSADGVVSVRFMGACIGCPSSALTLHMGIERMMRQQIPSIARVVAV